MKILTQFGIILAIWWGGEWINRWSGIPIPGAVIGIFILFLLLLFKIIKVEMLQELSEFFLSNLAFFFIPPGVALMSNFGLIKGIWAELLLIIILTSIITIVVTGFTVQFLVHRKEKHERIIE